MTTAPTTQPRRLVVVGASLAGLRAVEAARRHGFDGEITLIGAEKHLPYDRPPLSKAYLLDSTPTETMFRTPEQIAELDVTLCLGEPATGLDTDTREVVWKDTRVGYDALVIATGAAARSLPGTEGLAGVHVLRTLDDAAALRSALDTNPRKVVVVGAGFIGSEVASAARARGLEVTIVEAAAFPLARSLGPRLGEACSLLHLHNGTELRTGVSVSAVEGESRVERVRLSDGSVLPADLVVVGIGASPCVEWLADSGIRLDDGVLCDERLATSVPGVYAAGDVARWTNPLFGRSMRLEHWTSAAEQGAVAARNAVEPAAARPYTTVPYFWSDWYGTRIQFVGIPADKEQVVVTGGADQGRMVALYRDGDRLAGTLLIGHPASTMKYRGLIAKTTSWDDALAFARDRHR